MRTRMVRVSGLTVAATKESWPLMRRPGSAATSASTLSPMRIIPAFCSGMSATIQTWERSATTNIASAGCTTCPVVTLRSITVPSRLETTWEVELTVRDAASLTSPLSDMPSTLSWSRAADTSASACTSSDWRRCSSARPITSASKSCCARCAARSASSFCE